MRSILRFGGVGVAMFVLALSGCERSEPAGSAPVAAKGGTAVTIPPELFSEAAPAEARDVAAVKRDATLRGPVVVRGRIGGRTEPFVQERATFLLADASLPTCSEKHGDGCPTPWDYCCETPETILANTLTVQVVDAGGQPLKTGLAGAHGLKPTARVTVEGEIVQRDESTVVVNARKIFVEG